MRNPATFIPTLKIYVALLAIPMIIKIASTGKDRKMHEPTVPSGIRNGLGTTNYGKRLVREYCSTAL